jgi:hypothetical protein
MNLCPNLSALVPEGKYKLITDKASKSMDISSFKVHMLNAGSIKHIIRFDFRIAVPLYPFLVAETSNDKGNQLIRNLTAVALA